MLNRMLTIEIARVTEAAAIAAARWRGRGDEKAADQAAVDAMRQALNQIMLVDGLVVIGEGERDQAPDALYRREGRRRRQPEHRYRARSAGRNDALRQGDAQCHRGHRHG